jgi:hypothetical protein
MQDNPVESESTFVLPTLSEEESPPVTLGLGLATSKSLPALTTTTAEPKRGVVTPQHEDYLNITQPAEGNIFRCKISSPRLGQIAPPEENASSSKSQRGNIWCLDKRERQKQIRRDQVKKKRAREAKALADANVLLVEQHARAEWQRRCTQTQMLNAGVEPLVGARSAAATSHPAQMGFILTSVNPLNPYKESPMFYGYKSSPTSKLMDENGKLREPRSWILRTYAGPLTEIKDPTKSSPNPKDCKGMETIYHPACFGCVLKPTRSVNPSFVHPMFMNKKLESNNQQKLIESLEKAAEENRDMGAASEAATNGLDLNFFNSLMPQPTESCPICLKHDSGCPACWQVPTSEAEWSNMTARNGKIKSSLAEKLHTKLCNRTLIDEHRAINKDFIKINVKTVPSGRINSFVIDKSDTVAYLYQMFKSVAGPNGSVEEIHLLLPTVRGFFYIDNVDYPGSDVRLPRYTCDMLLSSYNLSKGEEVALLNVSFMLPEQTAYMARKYLSLNILMKKHYDLERVVYEVDDLPESIEEDDVQRSLKQLLQYSMEHAKETAIKERYDIQKAQEEKLRNDFEAKRTAAIEHRLMQYGGSKKQPLKHILPEYNSTKKTLIQKVRDAPPRSSLYVRGRKRELPKPRVKIFYKKVYDVLEHPFKPHFFFIDIFPFDKIGHLRALVSEKVEIPEENVFLYFRKKRLTDMHARLVDCDVQMENKLTLETLITRTRREIILDFVAKKTKVVLHLYQKHLPPERRQKIYDKAILPIAMTKEGYRRGKQAYADALEYYIRRTYGNLLGIELSDSDED